MQMDQRWVNPVVTTLVWQNSPQRNRQHSSHSPHREPLTRPEIRSEYEKSRTGEDIRKFLITDFLEGNHPGASFHCVSIMSPPFEIQES